MEADAGRLRDRTPGAGENKVTDLVARKRSPSQLGPVRLEEAGQHIDTAWVVLSDSDAIAALGIDAPRGAWIAASHLAIARAALRGLR